MSRLCPPASVVAVVGLLLGGCALSRPVQRSADSFVPPDNDGTTSPADAIDVPVVRVGGDLLAITDHDGREYRAGDCRIATPLPDGYPPPTPPGAVEIKRYPLVRRAQIAGTMWPDWGMSMAFFPLFNHINRRDIAMTSPVEMNYDGLADETSGSPDSWVMSFVYRTPEMGDPGIDPHDDRVLIEDMPPRTVLALGMRGPYEMARVNLGLTELRQWLSGQTEWESDGEPRAMFYNGPDAASPLKWAEVQIPVRRR